jgi:hypothetical protein
VRGCAKSAILIASFMAAGSLGLSAESADATGSSAWVLGIARFGLAKVGDPPSILQETLPRLIVANLKTLPTRRVPGADAEESARLQALRKRFTAGTDLASLLDARAARFFDPSLDRYALKNALATADKQVKESSRKLAEIDSAKDSAAPPSADLATQLWEGHAKGQLVDTPASGFSQAIKSLGLNFFVTGTIAIRSGYATVLVRGFDVTLDREAFSWKTFCAIDDPEPLAVDIAKRLEQWIAGRPFARVILSLNPASAMLRVNGGLFEGTSPIFYEYHDEKMHIDVSSTGYSPQSLDLDLKLGERVTKSIKLDPLSTGNVLLKTDPTEAAISLDSVPVGRSPLTIGLDGSRGIATVSAEGWETQAIVLPSSGESELSLSLIPSDQLGPAGRIAAAKDYFYQSLGWFVLSIPVASLAAGVYGGYYEAAGRSAAMLPRYYTSTAVLAVSVVACATTATIMIIRLVKYLKTAH